MDRIDKDLFARVRAVDPLGDGATPNQQEMRTLEAMREQIVSQDRSVPAPRRSRHPGVTIAVGASAAGVIVAVLVAIGVSGGFGGSSGTSGGASPTPVFSVLSEPGTAVLRTAASPPLVLPEWIRTNASLHLLRVDAASGRLALSTSGRNYYVARAGDGSEICLIDAVQRKPGPQFRPGDPGSITCRYTDGHAQTFAQGFVTGFLAVVLHYDLTASGALGAEEATIAGVVPDGFTRVRIGGASAKVTNNVFVAQAEPWRPIIATGPGGTRTVWLGVAPPEAQPAMGTPLGVALFSQPPTPVSNLPRFVRNSLRDPPAGRHAWLAGDAGGVNYWVLTTGRLGASVVTTIDTSDHITVGSTVTVQRLGSSSTATYLLIDPPGGPLIRLSPNPGTALLIESALGRALVGHRPGDTVKVDVGGHTTTYRVVSFDPNDGGVAGGSWPTTTDPALLGGVLSERIVASTQETVAYDQLAGLVADGYTTLAGGGVRAQVHDNFVALAGIESDGPPIKMTLSGAAGRWTFYLSGPGVFPSGPWLFGRVALQVPSGS